MSSAESTTQPNAAQVGKLATIIRPYSQSPLTIWGIAGLFFASSIIPPNARLPPLMHRVGFGAIFTGAGYVLSCGDVRNGSGITTAWSLIYLFFNLRKSLSAPRNAVSLALSAATLTSSALYGTEYFILQEKET